MKIRAKTALIISAVCLCTIIGVYLLSQTVLTSGFVSLEETTTSQEMEKVVSSFNDTFNSLILFASDYAQWNDTYSFIENNNTAYIQDNLVDSTFQYSNVDFMIYINQTGGVVYAKAYNQSAECDIPISQELMHTISNNEELWHFDTPTENVAGILTLSNTTVMISSEPILTSEANGPVRGAVIIGKYLDPARINALSGETHLPLALYRTDDPYLPDDFRVANSTLSIENPLFARALNGTVIGGYALITDIFSNPAIIVRAEMPRTLLAQGQTTINYFLLLLIAGLVIVFATIMILLEKGVLYRLTKLNGEIGSLGESSDLSKRVQVKGDDEITSLAQSLNAMLERIENTTTKLTRAERFSTIGELATTVGNDLRNPLQGIRNATYSLRKGTKQVEESRRMLDEIEKSITYSDNIVRNLVEYSQELRPELTKTTPKTIATKALHSIEIPNSIHLVDRTDDDETTIIADSNLLSRALANLIQNAVEAMPKGGNLTVESTPLNDKLEFNVIDTGCGFPEEFKNKIGNPLVTRKARGMGFGLAITKRILEAHGGSLQAESTAGKGSTFKIVLPLTDENATITQNNHYHLH